MVRVMPWPQETVHNVLMSEPGNPFHKQERPNNNSNLSEYVHKINELRDDTLSGLTARQDKG